jgi:hypothetical protein
MTIGRFNSLLTGLPFKKLYQERIGFGGKHYKFTRYLNGPSKLPGLGELFYNALFTVLAKSSDSQ